jgi:hypothetical protein
MFRNISSQCAKDWRNFVYNAQVLNVYLADNVILGALIRYHYTAKALSTQQMYDDFPIW